MNNKKCIKGESCLHCGSSYCQLTDEINDLKAENEKYKAEIMSLRQGYDEEDCTTTCPTAQFFKAENEKILNLLDTANNQLILLQEDLTELQQTYSDCETEYKSLYNRYSELLNKYNKLKESNSADV